MRNEADHSPACPLVMLDGPAREKLRNNKTEREPPATSQTVTFRPPAMQKSPPLFKQPISRRKGFTLIELLTVIAIIAILLGLLLPAMNAAKNAAKKSQAQTDMHQLVLGVRSYYADYGFYPVNANNAAAGAVGYDTCYGDPNGLYSTADLCDILRAIPDNRFNQNNQLNTRRVIYFEGNNAKSLTSPRSGYTAQAVTGPQGNKIPAGAYVDPWGMEYVVFIDADYLGNVNQALGWFYYKNTPVVNAGVAACSLGMDGQWGKAGNGDINGSDDLATWQ